MNRGFTLIELLVVLAIAIIVLTLGIPSVQSWVAQTRADSAAQRIVQTLLFARSQSVGFRREILVCSLRGGTCASDWQNGMSVIIDNNRNLTVDNDDTVLYQTEAFSLKDKLTFPFTAIRFSSDGMSNNYTGNFRYCALNDPDLRAGAKISASGQVRLMSYKEFSNCE